MVWRANLAAMSFDNTFLDKQTRLPYLQKTVGKFCN
jgi:hypothetical protein